MKRPKLRTPFLAVAALGLLAFGVGLQLGKRPATQTAPTPTTIEPEPSVDGEVLNVSTIPTETVGEHLGLPGGSGVTLPSAVNVSLIDCDPVESGYGVTMKAWGDIRLPYAFGWPTNEPGTVVDCAPQTDFGGAVAAAHGLYLEAVEPELIPFVAWDTPGRQLRIDSHPDQFEHNLLGMVCEPVGWFKAETSRWRIFHRCGDGPVKVTEVQMKWVENRWLMVYDITGIVTAIDAMPDDEFHPFGGGD